MQKAERKQHLLERLLSETEKLASNHCIFHVLGFFILFCVFFFPLLTTAFLNYYFYSRYFGGFKSHCFQGYLEAALALKEIADLHMLHMLHMQGYT